MTLVHRQEDGQQYLCATAEGVVTFFDIRDVLAIERTDGGFDLTQLIDLRQASPCLSVPGVHMLASWLQTFVHAHMLGPTAILVSAMVDYGMVRMLEILVDGVCRIKPFFNPDDAHQWLGECNPA
jgi:hypothetical protein